MHRQAAPLLDPVEGTALEAHTPYVDLAVTLGGQLVFVAVAGDECSVCGCLDHLGVHVYWEDGGVHMHQLLT